MLYLYIDILCTDLRIDTLCVDMLYLCVDILCTDTIYRYFMYRCVVSVYRYSIYRYYVQILDAQIFYVWICSVKYSMYRYSIYRYYIQIFYVSMHNYYMYRSVEWNALCIDTLCIHMQYLCIEIRCIDNIYRYFMYLCTDTLCIDMLRGILYLQILCVYTCSIYVQICRYMYGHIHTRFLTNFSDIYTHALSHTLN